MVAGEEKKGLCGCCGCTLREKRISEYSREFSGYFLGVSIVWEVVREVCAVCVVCVFFLLILSVCVSPLLCVWAVRVKMGVRASCWGVQDMVVAAWWSGDRGVMGGSV